MLHLLLDFCLSSFAFSVRLRIYFPQPSLEHEVTCVMNGESDDHFDWVNSGLFWLRLNYQRTNSYVCSGLSAWHHLARSGPAALWPRLVTMSLKQRGVTSSQLTLRSPGFNSWISQMVFVQRLKHAEHNINLKSKIFLSFANLYRI